MTGKQKGIHESRIMFDKPQSLENHSITITYEKKNTLTIDDRCEYSHNTTKK